MSQPILVTGCTGFIGANFVRQFKAQFPDREIIGIDDFSSGRRDALDQTITFYEGSILDEPLLTKLFSTHKPEYVFHFAAMPRVSLPLITQQRRPQQIFLARSRFLTKPAKMEPSG